MFNTSEYNEVSTGDTYSVRSYDLYSIKQNSFDSEIAIYLGMTQNSQKNKS